ncbi:hypothetical protein ACIRPX_07610 [Streptomyces sp. NPDC101225]|uniref:hypothetical protein n=1 Tax=Streptomyces sp. NPDC101225 TaxID=3366135 RepID=UPI00380FD9D4
MFDAVVFGAGGAICLVLGMWFVLRQRRRHAGTLAGWGAVAVGVGQFLRAVGSLTDDHQPLGAVLVICFSVVSVAGFIMVVRGRDTSWNARGGQKPRKLPPINRGGS